TLMRIVSLSFIALFTLWLSGCQIAPKVDEPEQQAEKMTHWQAKGRFAYKSPTDGGSASIHWLQEDDQGELKFSGPMGFGSAELQWQPGYAILTTSKGEATAHSAEALALELTGVAIPVDALMYWLKGLKWPKTEADTERNDEGRLTRLQQNGWDIKYERWQQVPGGYWLPHKLKATHQQD